MRRDIPPYEGLTRLILADRIERYSWAVGDHTYGHPRILEEAGGRLEIGRFCSIAAVTIVLANHVSSHATTYPFDAFRPYWPNMSDASCHRPRDVTVGSDVWLAEGAMLMPGAQVGHGAIVGAGAIVRGVVPPYAIVAGNPATVLRFRFDPPTIARLLRTAWWDRSDIEINHVLPFLVSNDLEALLQLLEANMPPGPAQEAVEEPAPEPVPETAPETAPEPVAAPQVTPLLVPVPAPVAEPVFVQSRPPAQEVADAAPAREPGHAAAAEEAPGVETQPALADTDAGTGEDESAPARRRSAWSILSGR